MVRCGLLVVLANFLALLVAHAAAQEGVITRVSLASDGTQANARSYNPAISPDGRYVAFASAASNLVPYDTNGWLDIFVRDLATGTTIRASVDSSGNQANETSWAPAFSPDGRFVAFTSSASNLVANDANGHAADVFIHDLILGTTTIVSMAPDGSPGNGVSWDPMFSANGRYLAFFSTSSNLVPNDTNGKGDVFVRDLVTGLDALVSVASDGTQGNGDSYPTGISSDGRYVLFDSDASNLVPGDTNASRDVFLRDTLAGTTTRVSVASDGSEGNYGGSISSMSSDGRFITFSSYSSNLVPGDSNEAWDVFVRDMVLGTTALVSVNSAGQEGNNSSEGSSISPDGRYVAFCSQASNLVPVPGDTNGFQDVFVRDLVNGTTTRITLGLNGEQANAPSCMEGPPVFGANGAMIAFDSAASNLVPGDTNWTINLFVYQIGADPGISGKVELQDYAASQVLGTPVTIEVRLAGSTTPLQTQTVLLGASGDFSFTAHVGAGVYDITAKASHWLRQKIGSLVITTAGASNLAFSLVNGDITGDNAVSLADFGLLKRSYGSMPGNSNWNSDADLDGNGSVGLGDFGILKRNYSMSGDD